MNTLHEEANVDRSCDKCGAHAMVKVRKGSRYELLLCGHHFAKHEMTLAADGWRVVEVNEQCATSAVETVATSV